MFSRPDSADCSLILPCWQDDQLAATTVARWQAHPFLREILVAGAPGCCANAQELEDLGARCTYAEKAGRGGQLNAAAARASGDVLLFHHLDSKLTEAHLDALQTALTDPAVQGGAFHRKFDIRHPGLLWLEPVERWHCRKFGTLYGDQSFFARRTHFQSLGGFPDYPLMEDVAFSHKLRRAGGLVVLDPPMRSSPRRHLEYGAWRMTLMNIALLLLYHAGVSPTRLHAWYYRHRNQTKP